jgi:hypothetical protein
MKHILFQKALFFKRREILVPPENYEYDYFLGAWINTIDKSLLIDAQNFKSSATKKFDVETGEDHKGQ